MRFILTVLALWTGVRLAMLLPGAAHGIGAVIAGPAFVEYAPVRPGHATAPVAAALRAVSVRAAPPPVPWVAAAGPVRRDRAMQLLRLASAALPGATGFRRHALLAEIVPFAASPSPRPRTSRWSGSAWLFARGGSDTGLAAGSQLGGGQAGARIAYRIAAPIAAAARVSSPLATARGAEAAVGVDVHPLPALPLRLSVERRFDLGGQGRNAWSAYAAGGVYKSLGKAIDLDGYVQAGVVGVKARDLFADGALRIGRRVELGEGRVLRVGAGAWGAAQPGAARLDVGPRVALTLPAGRATLSAAIEGRIRIAGDARPGTGVALTLASDF